MYKNMLHICISMSSHTCYYITIDLTAELRFGKFKCINMRFDCSIFSVPNQKIGHTVNL